jgi:hypothetical protein
MRLDFVRVSAKYRLVINACIEITSEGRKSVLEVLLFRYLLTFIAYDKTKRVLRFKSSYTALIVTGNTEEPDARPTAFILDPKRQSLKPYKITLAKKLKLLYNFVTDRSDKAVSVCSENDNIVIRELHFHHACKL